MKFFKTIDELNKVLVKCRKCPRLVKWREKIAIEKTKRYSDWEYWGKPVPGFGDKNAQLLIIGLAPAAHGGNRTGRMFTGDRSGEWLYRALFKFGFSNKPDSISSDDGLKLYNCYITASIRCVPPENKPTKEEIENCNNFLKNEIKLLKNVKVIITLGKIAFDTAIKTLSELNLIEKPNKLSFSHAHNFTLSENLTLICSYHPSQRNTFTGKLTEEMFDTVFAMAKGLLSKHGIYFQKQNEVEPCAPG